MKNWKTSLLGQIAYMAGTGAGLLFMPQVVSDLLQLGPVSEVWVRVVGLLALLLCVYYYAAIKNEAVWFARGSVWARYGFCAALVGLSFLFHIPMLIGLAVVESALAVWTQWSLSKS
jgi:hypothetical protein